MNKPLLVVLAVLAALSVNVRAARAQSLDLFAPVTNGAVRAVAVQEDGSVILGGDFTTVTGYTRNHIARVLPSGVVDDTFDPNADGPIYAIVVQPDGKIVIGGSFTQVGTCGGFGNRCYTNIARLNADGSVDTGFLASWANAEHPATALALQPDGKLLAVIDSTVLIRYNADGSSDSGFWDTWTQQIWCPRTLRAVAVQPDGKILMAGRGGIMRVIANGAPDPSFGTTRVNFSGEACGASDTNCVSMTPVDYDINTIGLQPDGKILVGGNFVHLAGTVQTAVGRLNSGGTFDTGFVPDGFDYTTAVVHSMALRADGLILVGGNVFRQVIVAYQPYPVTLQGLKSDGTRDDTYLFETWLSTGSGLGPVYALAIDVDLRDTSPYYYVGKLVFAGAFDKAGGPARGNVARLTTEASYTQQIYFDVSTGELTWFYSGSCPEFMWARFEYSPDNRTNWRPWATATRTQGAGRQRSTLT